MLSVFPFCVLWVWSWDERRECPLCTFHNERGRFVCEACETGRPRQQDLDAMDEDDEVDGFVVTNPQRGYRRGDARGRMQAVGGGSEFQLLQNILDGAMLGAGAGGAASIMTGASPAQARQRMLSGEEGHDVDDDERGTAQRGRVSGERRERD